MITPELYTSYKACHVLFQRRGCKTVETYEVDAGWALSPSVYLVYNRAETRVSDSLPREETARVISPKFIERFY